MNPAESPATGSQQSRPGQLCSVQLVLLHKSHAAVLDMGLPVLDGMLICRIAHQLIGCMSNCSASSRQPENEDRQNCQIFLQSPIAMMMNDDDVVVPSHTMD